MVVSNLPTEREFGNLCANTPYLFALVQLHCFDPSSHLVMCGGRWICPSFSSPFAKIGHFGPHFDHFDPRFLPNDRVQSPALPPTTDVRLKHSTENHRLPLSGDYYYCWPNWSRIASA